MQVRDQALKIHDEIPKSDVGKEYYQQNLEREVTGDRFSRENVTINVDRNSASYKCFFVNREIEGHLFATVSTTLANISQSNTKHILLYYKRETAMLVIFVMTVIMMIKFMLIIIQVSIVPECHSFNIRVRGI